MTNSFPSSDGNSQLAEAVYVYKGRKGNTLHPSLRKTRIGLMPTSREEQACCADAPWPSWRWPYKRAVHCRTAAHVALLCGVDVEDLKREARRPSGITSLYCSLRANGSSPEQAQAAIVAASA